MGIKRLTEGEARFMDIIWDSEPVPSGKLVDLCKEKLGWQKSTTYTLIRRMSNKGLLKNENSTVTALVSRKEVQIAECNYMVDQTFAGSLPSFLVAFLGDRTLSREEADELKKMIDRHSK